MIDYAAVLGTSGDILPTHPNLAWWFTMGTLPTWPSDRVMTYRQVYPDIPQIHQANVHALFQQHQAPVFLAHTYTHPIASLSTVEDELINTIFNESTITSLRY